MTKLHGVGSRCHFSILPFSLFQKYLQEMMLKDIINFNRIFKLKGIVTPIPNFRNPGIPLPGGGIKRGLLREFRTQSGHLVK